MSEFVDATRMHARRDAQPPWGQADDPERRSELAPRDALPR